MKKIFTLTALLLSMFILSCQKDVNVFVTDKINLPDTVWQNTLSASMPVMSLKADLKLPQRTDSFVYNNTDILFANGLLSLFVPGQSLVTNSGTAVTGTVTEKTLLLQRKGDFIKMDMPTVSDNRLLVSGGSFFIDLKKGNDTVFVPQDKKISLKYSSNIGTQNMKVYNAQGDPINGFNWTANTDIDHNKVTLTGTGFEVFINRTQWVQPAYLFDTTGIPQTTLSIKLPSNYTNTNTEVYVVFNDMHCVAGTRGNAVTRNFETGNLPSNRTVTIVVLSKQAGDYYLGQQQLLTATTSQQQLTITPVKRSLDFITNYLNGL